MTDKPTAAELQRVRKGRILNEKEQDRAIVLLGRGYTQSEVTKKMRISGATWTITQHTVEGFQDRVKAITAARMNEIETTAFKLALGAVEEVRITWVAKLNKDGEPCKTPDGKRIMLMTKKEVRRIPPSWQAIQFLLQTRMPDVYSTKALQHDNRAESIELIRALLEGKVKDMEATGQPYQMNLAAVKVQSTPLPEAQ